MRTYTEPRRDKVGGSATQIRGWHVNLLYAQPTQGREVPACGAGQRHQGISLERWELGIRLASTGGPRRRRVSRSQRGDKLFVLKMLEKNLLLRTSTIQASHRRRPLPGLTWAGRGKRARFVAYISDFCGLASAQGWPG
jgi:hypothetical protein